MTLSTLRGRNRCVTSLHRYLAATLACAAFSAVYEHFSHGVYSAWMVGLGAWPLVLGVLPAVVCSLARIRVGRLARDLWACGVTTLAMGSSLRGVLEIYGTTSSLVAPYLPVGTGLLMLAVITQAVCAFVRVSAKR